MGKDPFLSTVFQVRQSRGTGCAELTRSCRTAVAPATGAIAAKRLLAEISNSSALEKHHLQNTA